MKHRIHYKELKDIHDELVGVVDSSHTSAYRDAYLWLLVAQIPETMKNYGKHEFPKPLLDALCEACGSDYERAWILGN
jgi:hypothetical protein